MVDILECCDLFEDQLRNIKRKQQCPGWKKSVIQKENETKCAVLIEGGILKKEKEE